MTDLTGKVAIVTGAAGNLGSYLSEVLLKAGAWVILTDRDGEPLNMVDESLRLRYPEQVASYKADVTVLDDINRVLSVTERWKHCPNILVNCAGFDQPPGSSAVKPADVFGVNALGLLNCMETIGLAMMDYKTGTIISIGSVYTTETPDPNIYDDDWDKPPAYGASKAAAHSLVRYYAKRFGPYGVRVNTLSPGGVQAGQDDGFVKRYSAKVPLDRMARLDDLAGPLLFLASDASKYITGQELRVDGGYGI